jgi:hypothetical protein
MPIFTKLVEVITKENTKLPQTDPRVQQLKVYQDDLEFLNVTDLISRIIKLKIKLWFRYKWKTILFWIVLISLITGGIIWGYSKLEERYVYIKIHEQVEKSKDSVMFIGDPIKPEVKEYFDFIASTESDYAGKYTAYNKNSDAWGRFQFIPIARQMFSNMGVTFTKEFFMTHPEFQDVMMYIFMKENHNALKSSGIYDKYVGKMINGYYISQCGLLSMSHAIGVGGVANFLISGCKRSVLPAGAPEADKRLTIQKYRIVFTDTTITSVYRLVDNDTIIVDTTETKKGDD